MTVTRSVLAATVCGLGFIARTGLGQVVYVDAAAAPGGTGLSWGSAYNDLQAGLAAARSSLAVTEVRVAGGVYRPGPAGDRSASFQLVERVALRGGYAGGASATPDARDLRGTPTVLSGDLAGDDISGEGRGVRYDNAYHVVTAVGLVYPAVIDGFHIVSGFADGSGVEGRGGGMLVDQCAGNLTVSRCTLRDNYGQFGGAAMVYDSAGVFSQCVVTGNRANMNPGVEVNGYRLGVTPRFVACTIAMNTSAFPYGSAGLVSQASGANPDLEGPAVIAVRVPVVSCVVFGNASSASVQYPPQFGGFYEATACLSSDADGWQGGVRQNVTGDPRFANPAGADGIVGTLDDDFRLLQGSPAINAGAGAPADLADVDTDGNLTEPAERDGDGLARLHGASVDIGAFEGPVLAVVTSPVALSINEGSTLTYNVKLTRDPGGDILVSTFAAAVGGTGLVVTPPTVTLGSANWSEGVDVTLSWPADVGLTDETTALVFTGPGMAPSSQTVVQVDGTTPPSVLYVNVSATLPADGTTWATGYRRIEDALAVAVTFPQIQQVWVAAGTYRPPLTPGQNDQRLRKYVMRSGLKLVGGFAGTETSKSQRVLGLNKTLITGDNQGDDGPGFTNYGDNCEVLLLVNGAVAGTQVDGIEFERSTVAAVNFNLSSPDIDNLSVMNCRFAFNRGIGLKRLACQGISEVTSCVFEDNGELGEPSSACYLRMYGNGNPVQRVDVTGCVFRRNKGAAGCGLWFSGARLNLSVCLFSLNSANGAAVRSMGASASVEVWGSASDPVMAAIDGCSFTDNTGTASGGGLAIAYTGSTGPVRTVSRVRGCAFARNSSSYAGGLYLAASGGGSHEVIGCAFTLNNAATAGAGSGGRFINCVFQGNSAQTAGAGPTDAEGCEFENNTATGAGGVSGDSQRFVRCTFRNNTAASSGAVTGAQLIDACVFINNHATAGSNGAVGGCPRAINSLFIGNTATGDGGVGRVLDSVSCRFSGNSAGGNGGALFDVLRTSNCLFTGNTAGGTGGAVYSVWNVIGCTVYGNHAASVGGIDAVNLTTASTSARHAVNSVFWGNTAATGTVEQKQLRFATSSDPYSEQFGSGRNGAVGVETTDFVCTVGPLTGGFTEPFPAALLSGGPVPPYTRAVVAAPPAGGLSGLLPVFNPVEQWVSPPVGVGGSFPSVLLQTGGGPAPLVYATVEWKVSVLADGQLGDAVNPGVFMGTVPMPASTGGTPGVQTDWTFDASDAAEPGVGKRMSFYVRNDTGFGGACIRSTLRYFHPPVAWCVIEGLSVHTGNGNIGSDPGLDLIEGPDGVLGTLDDDGTPRITSLAIDSGNSRMVAVDQYDIDGDGSITEVFMTDLDGRPRVSDCVVDNGAVGVRGPIDRGAVEVSPFQALLAPPCAADIGSAGGVYGRDGVLDNNDFIAFIDAFFLFSPVADVGTAGGVAGSDGLLDNNDFIVFIDLFFAGC